MSLNELYFRTDMNRIVATGHIMRCLSIADVARSEGIKCTFILADNAATDLLISRQYSYIILGTHWNDMNTEIDKMISLIRIHKIKKIIIDSYYVSDAYLNAISNETETWYIDDLNAFHYNVHGIICYANYWKKFRYHINYPDTELILGTEYVPLRSEFKGLPKKKISSNIGSILLLSGGSDEYNVIGQLIAILYTYSNVRIDAVCGCFNSRFDALVLKYKYYDNIFIHKSLSDIDKYMKNDDLAISAGGTTLYELCACGTPTISYSLADNQLDNVRQFDLDGVIKYAGDVRTDDVATKVIELIRQYDIDEVRKQFSVKMQKSVDGNGAKRIVERIMN